MTVSENTLLEAIKKLAVQPVARGVRRTELINMTQDSGEPIASDHSMPRLRDGLLHVLIHVCCLIIFINLIVSEIRIFSWNKTRKNSNFV